MLQFNPNKRLTATEALKSEVFAHLKSNRNGPHENKPFDMQIYAESEFDYEKNEQTGLQIDELKQMLIKEARAYQQPGQA